MASESEIINFLSKANSPVRTLDLAKQLLGESGTAKNVNPILYRLQKEGKLEKIANSDGTNPRWWLKSKGEIPKDSSDPYATVKSFIRSEDISDEESVIQLLGLSTEPVPTLLVSKGVFGKGATTKMINPLLYSMQKQGKVKKTSDLGGKSPRWSLS